MEIHENRFPEKVSRIESVLFVDAGVEFHEEDSHNQKHASHDPERDLLPRIPRVDASAERDGHGQARGPSKKHDSHGPVHHLTFLDERSIRLWVN